MTKQPRHAAGKKFSGNHQRSWLWGYHAVIETLAAGNWPVLEIYVTQSAYERSASILDQKDRQGIPLYLVSAERIEQLSRATEHQGMLVRLGPFAYKSMKELEEFLLPKLKDLESVELSVEKQQLDYPLLLMCDRLQDSFNLGAILRCCDGANVLAVIVGEKAQADITSHVARSSSGAVNHLPIVQTDDLVSAASRMKSLGLKILAADSNATASMWEADLKQPAMLIVGSEAHGVDERLLQVCDQRVVIPMQGRVSSLNAAVAAGILLYEIRRQQRS